MQPIGTRQRVLRTVVGVVLCLVALRIWDLLLFKQHLDRPVVVALWLGTAFALGFLAYRIAWATPAQDRSGLQRNLAALHLPNGHTVTVGHGRWMSPERGLVSEKCVMVMVWADRGSDVHKAFLAMCADYKAAAAQDAVGVTMQEVDLDFV